MRRPRSDSMSDFWVQGPVLVQSNDVDLDGSVEFKLRSHWQTGWQYPLLGAGWPPLPLCIVANPSIYSQPPPCCRPRAATAWAASGAGPGAPAGQGPLPRALQLCKSWTVGHGAGRGEPTTARGRGRAALHVFRRRLCVATGSPTPQIDACWPTHCCRSTVRTSRSFTSRYKLNVHIRDSVTASQQLRTAVLRDVHRHMASCTGRGIILCKPGQLCQQVRTA